MHQCTNAPTTHQCTNAPRHAVAIEIQTNHCPHSRDDPTSTCEALGGNVRDYYTAVDVRVSPLPSPLTSHPHPHQVRDYYTTVDVLVIDGDPRHPIVAYT